MKLNFEKMIGSGLEAAAYIKDKIGLYVSYEKQTSSEEEFLRVNTACSRSALENYLHQLKNGIKAYEQFCVERC